MNASWMAITLTLGHAGQLAIIATCVALSQPRYALGAVVHRTRYQDAGKPEEPRDIRAIAA